jgi:hypothetical protein
MKKLFIGILLVIVGLFLSGFIHLYVNGSSVNILFLVLYLVLVYFVLKKFTKMVMYLFLFLVAMYFVLTYLKIGF